MCAINWKETIELPVFREKLLKTMQETSSMWEGGRGAKNQRKNSIWV
jgi:hypothetical protein